MYTTGIETSPMANGTLAVDEKKAPGNESALDGLALLFSAIAIVGFWFWLLSMPEEQRGAIFNSMATLAGILLLQPGIFLTVKILTGGMPVQRKIAYAALCMAVSGWVATLVANWIAKGLQSVPFN